MGSNTEKSNKLIYKTYIKNEAKRLRAISIWGAIQKLPKLLLQFGKISIFIRYQKLIRIFGGY